MLSVSAQRQHAGARLLAEGIETEAHLERARALGADFGQGYLLGRPGSIDAGSARPLAAVPRTASPPLLRGMSPYQLLAAERPMRRGSTEVIDAVQRSLEGRAAALGTRATIVSSTGPGPHADRNNERLVQLASAVGTSGCSGSRHAIRSSSRPTSTPPISTGTTLASRSGPQSCSARSTASYPAPAPCRAWQASGSSPSITTGRSPSPSAMTWSAAWRDSSVGAGTRSTAGRPSSARSGFWTAAGAEALGRFDRRRPRARA